MDAAHEIFRTPFAVTPTMVEVDTPGNYRKYREGAGLPPRIPVWVVHTDLESRDVGLVSDPYGFTDSPDCEFIGSGLNSKGPRSVALARQGNFFLWGFCAPPSALTEEARKVFLNALVYMKRFDGRRPLNQVVASGREWLVEYAWFMQNGSDSEYLRKRIDPDLLATGAELLATVERDLEFVRVDGEVFRIDGEVKAMRISNRDIRLLDVCVDALEKDAADARALRVLKRYTGLSFDDAKDWRAWLVQHRAALYFSDTAGYRFLIEPDKNGQMGEDDDEDGDGEKGKESEERRREEEKRERKK